MPTFPVRRTRPYYDQLKTHLGVSLNPLTGELWPEAVAEKVSEAIAAEPTVVDAAVLAVDNAMTISRRVSNCIPEWWMYPMATYQTLPYPRTIFGGADDESWILACEYNHAALRTERHRTALALGQGGLPDDHVPPALWHEHGRRPIIMWTTHNVDLNLHLKVGPINGDPKGLADAAEVLIPAGGLNSYPQIHKVEHLSTAAQDVFRVFYRRENGHFWSRQITVDQATGAVSYLQPVTQLIDFTGVPNPDSVLIQLYAATMPAYGGTNVVRMALCAAHRLSVPGPYYLEIDLATGAITQPLDPGFSANLDGTNLPITYDDLVPLDSTPARRFLFTTRAGPDTPMIAYVEGSSSSTWRNLAYELTPGSALLPAGGDASAAYHSDFNANAWRYELVCRLPKAAQSTDTDLGRRFASSTGWVARLRPDKAIQVVVPNSAGTHTRTSRVMNGAGDFAGIPCDWGDEVGLRVEVNHTAGTVEFFYSLDPHAGSPTWTQLGATQTITTGTATANTHPLRVPGVTNPVIPEVYRVRFSVLGAGTLLAGVDWRAEEWDWEDATHVDAAGRTWSLGGNAQVRPSRRLVDFGLAGPAFGNGYARGMAFPDPSHDGYVFVADGVGGIETLAAYRPAPGGGYDIEVLLQQPRAAGALVRPFCPRNGGPYRVIITDMVAYAPDNYAEYLGHMIGV